MMKRLFIVLFILCSLSGYSQTITQYIGTKTTTVQAQGSFKVDSALYLPTVQKYNPTWAGAIGYNAADSSLYYYSGTQWIKAGAGGGPEWDSYNSHDTLTQSRGIWMQTYGLTFYSSDGTTQNATGINNDGFTSRRGNGSLTQNSTWVYGQIQDPTSTYISRFQAIGLTNDSTHSTSMISTNGKTFNRKAAVVSSAWWEGVKLQANVNWKTSGSSTGYKGLTLTGGDGLGAGALSIDKEVLPEGTGQALLYDSLTNRVYRGTASGGGSSYTPTITTSSATTLTLGTSYETYVFTGSAATTWTLPAISGDAGRRYFIKNRGSANLVLQRAGTDQLYNTSLVNAITILPGGSFIVQNDGTYWVIL